MFPRQSDRYETGMIMRFGESRDNNLPPKPHPDEELVHADDTIIGKAVRSSLLVLVMGAALFGGTVFLLKRKSAPPPAQMTRLDAPVSPDRPQAKIPVAKFTDITR